MAIKQTKSMVDRSSNQFTAVLRDIHLKLDIIMEGQQNIVERLDALENRVGKLEEQMDLL